VRHFPLGKQGPERLKSGRLTDSRRAVDETASKPMTPTSPRHPRRRYRVCLRYLWRDARAPA